MKVATNPRVRASLELNYPLASTTPRVGLGGLPITAVHPLKPTEAFNIPVPPLCGTEGEKNCGYGYFCESKLFSRQLSGTP
jgi:hypothetical protein